jgi:hypothetical protein
VDLETAGPEATLELLRPARRFFIKGKVEHLFLRRGEPGAALESLRRHFIHEDGMMRVPVLMAGDVAVRGFHPDLYQQALAAAGLLPG